LQLQDPCAEQTVHGWGSSQEISTALAAAAAAAAAAVFVAAAVLGVPPEHLEHS
jgi:hypothetical protein